MSAYMVNTDTLALLATACRWNGVDCAYVYTPARPVTMGLGERVQDSEPIDTGVSFTSLNIGATDIELSELIFNELWAVNALALNDRYQFAGAMMGDTGAEYLPVNQIELGDPRDPLDWMRVLLGAIRCYEYQACEWHNWQGSWAQTYVDQIRRAVTRQFSNQHWEFERNGKGAPTIIR